MPINRPQLINDEFYHISSRTVGDTIVFDNENDFYRGIFSIYEFNNINPVNIWRRRQERKKEKATEKSIATSDVAKILLRSTSQDLLQESKKIDQRDKFVEILAFSFMPNHLHLILKQIKNNGITEFMRKVNGGYAKYFNEKYSRKGHLFNKFYPVHIKDDNQMKTTFTYVHTNLISLIEPGWKENGVKNPKKVKEFLENNKRHSYPDYLGKKNFPSVTEREFILELMGGSEECMAVVDNWIMHKKEIKDFRDIFLE